MKRMAVVLNLFIVLALIFAATTNAGAQGPAPLGPAPVSVESQRLPLGGELAATGADLKINPSIAGIGGRANVTIRLSADSVIDLVVKAQQAGKVATDAAQRGQLIAVKNQQSKFIAEALKIDPSAKLLGAVQRGLNAVMLDVDVSKLTTLALNSNVVKINPVVDYAYDMWDVVPYIGADIVQNDPYGYDGSGVKLAIIDSGIDYTHYDLFGSGNVADFTNNNPSIIEPGTFPTAKVIGGYDFVGAAWPNGPLAPDPDPLDKVTGAGYPHGTHVASTAAGRVGVAPGTSLIALKACSSVSSSCSGVAMMQSLDYVADPNGDGRVKDRIQLVNMSIGSPYGQAYEDDTSYMVNQLSLLGTLVVASAGNSGNIPYVTGTPGAALGALSTAATYNPTEEAAFMAIVAPYTAKYGAIYQSWSGPFANLIEANVVYGGSLGNALGCTPFAAGSLAGKIALVDRGTCAISLKIANMEAGGALAGVVGLVAPGEPTSFAFGGGTITIPGFNISQADATAVKNALKSGAVTARFDPNDPKALAGVVTGYSSRGPSYWASYLKPDITAPGNSYSAVAGSGTGFEFAGGTSFASPTVAGVAAQMMEKFPNLRGHDIKALLVGSADPETYQFSGQLAPVSRIGGGEVSSLGAANAKAYAYARKVSPTVGVDITSFQPSVSFFFNDITQDTTLTKNVIVSNVSNQALTYTITPTFRYADDEANGAVAVSLPKTSVTVPANGQANFRVDLNIDAEKLREWGFNTGSRGALGDVFTTYEYDGYLVLESEDAPTLTIPWHVVPRLADDIAASAMDFAVDPGTGMAAVDLTNLGAGQGYVDSFSLLAESPDDYLPPAMGANETFIDFRYFGAQSYATGSCTSGFIWAFAVNLWDRVTHANAPAAIEVYVDTNNDGTDDYVVLNWDTAYPNYSDGRNLTWVFNLTTGRGGAYFYTNHGSNSSNMVMYVCGEQLGLTGASINVPMGVSVYAWDNYFTGNYTDAITGLVAAPGGERYYGLVNTVAPGTTETMTVYDFGTGQANPDLGVLLFMDGDMGAVRAGAPEGNEALAIKALP